jgi:Mg-chelatase subunit ChlD
MRQFGVVLGASAVFCLLSCGAEHGDGSGNGATGAGASSGSAANGGGKNGAGGSGVPQFPDMLKGAAGSSGNEPTAMNNCGLVHNDLKREPADLLLVLDRSGSMKDPLKGSMATKWQDVTAALDPTIMATQPNVSWGLKLFPTGSTACAVDPNIEVAVAEMNYAAMNAAITAATPAGDGTPTRLAIETATMQAMASTSMHRKYLVLATDGQPNCADGKSTRANDPMGPVTAIETAAKAGIHTFVVGVATGGSSADTTLNNMAVAGGEPRAGATRYYAVNSKDELVKALEAITGLVVSCDFPLTKQPPSPNDVAVNVGGERITRDPNQKDGWNYDAGMTAVRLYGPPCDKVKAATTQLAVEIIFGCPGVVIP